jgi:hypothetical protein
MEVELLTKYVVGSLDVEVVEVDGKYSENMLRRKLLIVFEL